MQEATLPGQITLKAKTSAMLPSQNEPPMITGAYTG
jgi:hypothetical protein